MKAKELMEYLREFDEESELIAIAANPEKRKKYDGGLLLLTKEKQPVFIFEIKAEYDFDEEATAAAEQDERKAEQD